MLNPGPFRSAGKLLLNLEVVSSKENIESVGPVSLAPCGLCVHSRWKPGAALVDDETQLGFHLEPPFS